jgi:hypothetical protein
MLAHEGVVGVGVLPTDVDSTNCRNNSEDRERTNSIQSTKSQSSNNIPYVNFPDTNKPPVLQNHFSLMEEEEEENQYQSMLTSQTN